MNKLFVKQNIFKKSFCHFILPLNDQPVSLCIIFQKSIYQSFTFFILSFVPEQECWWVKIQIDVVNIRRRYQRSDFDGCRFVWRSTSDYDTLFVDIV